MNTDKITIHDMLYTDFISLIKETNRCPGGKGTVRRICELLHIDKDTHILEVGSNTGFTSLELARITPARLSGIDISEECVCVANETKANDLIDIQNRVTFQVGSSYDIPYENEEFDIIMTGGATGFMSDKNRALNEYFRVAKNWGFLVMTPLVYHTTPPQEIIDSINTILGTDITPMRADDWSKSVLSNNKLWELYVVEHKSLAARTDDDIELYVEYFMKKPHISDLPIETQDAIRKRWTSHIRVFNENHKYLGYSIQIYRKRLIEEEPELFIGS